MLAAKQFFAFAALFVLLLSGCAAPTQTPTSVIEISPVSIPLAGPLASPRSEISGLAWYRNNLILLPQYPDFEKKSNVDPNAKPGVFAIARTDILEILDGKRNDPLTAKKIKWVDDDLVKKIDAEGFDFQGYESITFVGDRVFVTVEAQSKTNENIMQSYLLAGTIQPDLSW